ncbi:MAG: DNA double-strand break repair nuclease NurA [Pyrinomonadaceae bacterium]|nr:DNA double-strand break repair nuclease NurA [Pyrinomonadaceae bacterium]
MLDNNKVLEKLKEIVPEIEEFLKEKDKVLENYQRILKTQSQKSLKEITHQIENKEPCEAIPSEELELRNDFKVPFPESKEWRNLEQALGWAKDVLSKRTTFAVDGGQDFIGKQLNLPVGIVQTGWFVNHHTSPPIFEKDSDVLIITPKEILDNQSKEMSAETYIGQKRFSREIEKAKEFVNSKKGWEEKGERMPVVFFDGAFVISLPRRQIQENIINLVNELVELSKEAKVPVVGYIDRSNSHELLSFFDSCDDSSYEGEKIRLDDSLLIYGLKLLENWGDRTIFFRSRRRDLFQKNETNDLPIGFVYLRVSENGFPVRLDIPSWVFDEGYLDETIEVVMAECIVGKAYPYCLSSADEMACIKESETKRLLEALERSSIIPTLKTEISRKSLTKLASRGFLL